MTEQEAKTKWCPLAQICLIPNASAEIQTCAGSNCMMWRWSSYVLGYDKEYRLNNPSCEKSHPLEKRDGYCGLGGKP
jgi:hypothetical protein